MNGLERLHPEFFPNAVQQRRDKWGDTVISPKEGALTKQALLSMYVECGGALHKGNLRNLLRKRFPTQIHYPDITAKIQKIVNLLEMHTVFLAGYGQMILCILSNSDDGGVTVAFAGKRG